jgi:hypothetical protein
MSSEKTNSLLKSFFTTTPDTESMEPNRAPIFESEVHRFIVLHQGEPNRLEVLACYVGNKIHQEGGPSESSTSIKLWQHLLTISSQAFA